MPRLLKFAMILIGLPAAALAEVPSAPASTPPRYAQNFEITAHPTHRLATIRDAQHDNRALHHYALVPKDSPLPPLPPGTTVIRTPVERVVALETVHIGYLDALQQLNCLVGAATVDFICNPQVRSAIAQGQIQVVQAGAGIDIERLLLLQPDLILTSTSGAASPAQAGPLARAGLPVVQSAGYLEPHPLARAEWLKFIAAFFNCEDRAAQHFDRVAARYESLCAQTRDIRTRPRVFCGAPYAGAWYMAGGASYQAQAIRDAGGDYLWADIPGSGARPLDTERVFLKAAHADIWLDPSFYRSRSALFAADPRFQKFHAAQSGKIFNNSKQCHPSGGNPIWESGIVRPDQVLADLIKVLHPTLLPEHQLVYYEQLR